MMVDKSIIFVNGNEFLRPETNAKCVLAQGVRSLHNLMNGEKPVLLPTLTKGSINTSDSRYSSQIASGYTTSIVMKNPILAPYAGVKFNIYIDPIFRGLVIKIYYGYNRGITSTTSNVSESVSDDLIDGDTFEFPSDNYGIGTGGWDKSHRYYRIGFFSESLNLEVDDIKNAIRLGYIAITYTEVSGNVVERNQRSTEIIEASKTNKTPSKHRNFVFTHISDIHGSGYALMNALRYSAAIRSQGLFISGDVVVQSSYDGYDYVHEMCKDFDMPSFICSGNHDGVGQTLGDFISNYFTNMGSTFGYVRSSNLVGYYYKDLDDPKIRVIALDCCDTKSSYRIHSVSSTQLSWLTETLSSTPTGYGVIITMHEPVGRPTSKSISDNPSFAKESDYNLLGSNDVNSITWEGSSNIKAAVDNFIRDGGEFIMYISGHIHADIVGILENTNNIQLQALISSPNGFLDMHVDTAILGEGIGKAQDLFNTYIIDRVNKTVTVVRVGSNICEDLSERLVERFQYAPKSR